MKKLILTFFVICFFECILCSPGLYAQSKVFVVGVVNHYWGAPKKGKSCQYSGYAHELLETFSKSRNYIFIYMPLPTKRLNHYIVTGKVDFKYPDSPYWDLKLKKGTAFSYTEAAAQYVKGVMVLPDNKGKGRIQKLGITMGDTAVEYCDEIENYTISVIENPSFIGLIKQAILKRVDGVYCDIRVAEHYLKYRIGNETVMAFDSSLPYSIHDYCLSTINHPDVIHEFNTFLDNQKTQNLALKQKYGIPEFNLVSCNYSR